MGDFFFFQELHILRLTQWRSTELKRSLKEGKKLGCLEVRPMFIFSTM